MKILSIRVCEGKFFNIRLDKVHVFYFYEKISGSTTNLFFYASRLDGGEGYYLDHEIGEATKSFMSKEEINKRICCFLQDEVNSVMLLDFMEEYCGLRKRGTSFF